MKIVVHPKYQSAKASIVQLLTLFDTHGKTVYKGRNLVKRFHTEHGDWIVKKYKTPNIFQKIAYTFWEKSKAEKAYLFAAKLLELGIDTPEEIAYIEKKKYGLLNDCYFISTVCDDPSINTALAENSNFDKDFATSLAAFCVEMHTRGFLHGDLNNSNILYRRDEQGELKFTVIDTNRSIFKSHPSSNECLDNLKRLTFHRELFQYIIEKYAYLRQWNISQSIHQAEIILNNFEKQRKRKRKIKSIIKRS
ncbi:lipopolysaccharide kinase InaA family protein [uncultured Bacteroides sp.]|uniref:lipopolysaccharide kinase InaA family protein n=1 Tax=uncultured Bacteroides sp. TaxID=162156 RepID=UPI002632513E|nr:lipopolysaccharide kinase InaA family protein [uncultured Bacteroides sp.]